LQFDVGTKQEEIHQSVEPSDVKVAVSGVPSES
jgi:hypothetical protein